MIDPKIHALFMLLTDAHARASDPDLVGFPFDERAERLAYRDGLLDAYVLVSGRSTEAALSDITETLIARAEEA